MLIPSEEIRRMLNQNEACKDALLEAADALANLQVQLQLSEAALKDVRQEKLLLALDDPTILGKNEAVREANLRAMCTKERSQVEEIERDIIRARNEVEGLRLEIDFLKTKIRIYELATKEN